MNQLSMSAKGGSAMGGKKLLFCLVLLAGLLAVQNLCQAASPLVLNNVPTVVYYPSEYDRLVLDFTLTPTTADTLKALTMSNLGTARQGFEITKVVLWQDNGNNVFEGMSKDTKIAEAAWNEANNYWYWDSLNLSLAGATHFYVSLETNNHAAVTIERSIQMQIPAFADVNKNKAFELGDSGLFLASGTAWPATALINDDTLLIRPATGDNNPPKAVFTEPLNGQTYVVSHFLMRGVARDQGESGIDLIQVFINGQLKGDAVALEANFAVWEYNWTAIAPGNYTIAVLAKDGYGNVNLVADSIIVTIGGEVTSYSKSTVIADKTSILANNTDKATATVTVINQSSQPVSGKTITLANSANVLTKILGTATDVNGKISFEAVCSKAGAETIKVSVDATEIGSVSLTCAIVPNQSGYLPGDLIKATGASVYYYGGDGKRYVFPNLKTFQTWYSDFSTVKTITDSQLASFMIGGNVTYKPGVKMVKIMSDPKVYAVGKNGRLHWITTEAIAVSLYGANWTSLVEDVPDSFFTNYTVDTALAKISDFDKAYLLSNITSINTDKGL